MPADHPVPTDPVVVGVAPISLADLIRVSAGSARVVVSTDTAYRARLSRGVERLAERVRAGDRIYGVTTGFGDSCEVDVDADAGRELALNLTRYHRAGTGAFLGETETIAVLVARLASLSRGYSAVRPELLDRLAWLVNERVLPRIPSEGSVGASGDLTPLAYVAAALTGEGEVFVKGRALSAAEVYRERGEAPLVLEPKEALALVNGTSVMTGLAVLAADRAARLGRFTATLTALAVEGLRGEPRHFDDRIFELKPHPGQRAFARWVRDDLGTVSWARARLQDRYSLRCAPHVGGVLLDVLPEVQRFLGVELNSVNDNPIVDPESGDVLLSGNFYGGHVCHAMDSLKSLVASCADLLDRQLALFVQPATSGGLPANLVAVSGPRASVHHGFKAMTITASALTSEALSLTMPSGAFSRSTESHNQDKVSLGTIAARSCLRVLELVETVAVVHLLAACQALELRGEPRRGPRATALLGAVRAVAPTNTGDRPMDADIRAVLELYRGDRLPIGVRDFP